MAIGWFSVLRKVPWNQVISSAPVVAEGAKKLWKTVGRKSAEPAPEPAPEPPREPQPPARSPEMQAITRLEAELAALQATAAQLQAQMLTSSELIKALADQNTELIKRVELHRIRLLWLAAAAALIGVAAVAGLLLAIWR